MKDDFIIELLSSGGKVSTKRVVTVGLLVLIGICSLTELFTDWEVSDSTFKALTYSFDAAVATVLVEKFSGKSKDKVKESKDHGEDY